MRRDGDQRLAQPPGHVLDEAGLAATCRPLQHHRQPFAVGRREDLDLAAERLVVGFRGDPIGIEGHLVLRARGEGSMFSRPSATVPSRMGYGSRCRKTRCGVEACEQATEERLDAIRTRKQVRDKLKSWAAGPSLART